MSEIWSAIWVLLVGVALGFVFFGGLWWTVRKGLASRYPAMWFIPSMLIRFAVLLSGFYLVGRHHWERMLMVVVGFWMARWLVGKFTKWLEMSDREAECLSEKGVL